MAPYFSSASTLDPNEVNHVVLDGRFRLLDPIGGGGSSIVYRAQHSTVDREVAVKIFEQTHLELPGALERFENEVRIIATLRHPNTVRLIDAGRYGTRGANIVTELLRVESLSRNRVSEKAASIQRPVQPRTVTPLPKKVVRRISSHTVLAAVLALELIGVCAAIVWS